MLEFKRIEITDKPWIDEAFRQSGFRGCEYTFGNAFVWRNVYSTHVCSYDGFCFVRYAVDGEYRFAFPTGNHDKKRGIELLAEYCRAEGIPLKLMVNKQCMEFILQLYPEAKCEFLRDSSDYVYLAEELSELKGKKFHAKRNHLNRFYENDWSFEPLTAENMAECIEMNDRWCAENIDPCAVQSEDELKSKEDESCIVRCSFKYFDKLGYTGGVLRVNGVVQAFSFGEQSADDTFVVHVEKAMREYQGTYAAINQQLVKSLGGKYNYINREEDTGAENLRKAKLSYNPIFLEEKYDILIDTRR